MQTKRVSILGVPIDTLTMAQTVAQIDESIRIKAQTHHVVVNAAKLVKARTDKNLYDSIVNCDIINPDGQSVIWASMFLQRPLPERVTGIDLMNNLVSIAAKNGYKIFLFGSDNKTLESVVTNYKNKYGNNLIAGYRNGYYSKDEENDIANAIAQSNADMLFVGITSPKKELFLNKYKALLKVPFIMGVGGSFDVIAGKTKRAPLWMQNAGLEWLYRVLQEPRRLWKRYLITNTLFVYLIIKERFLK